MPKSAKQRRGEIIYALRGKKRVTPEDLRDAMEEAGVECATSRRDYEEDLEYHKYLKRVPGGWKLTPESRMSMIITIKVTPSQNGVDVFKGLTAAMKQYKPLATMEIEA